MAGTTPPCVSWVVRSHTQWIAAAYRPGSVSCFLIRERALSRQTPSLTAPFFALVVRGFNTEYVESKIRHKSTYLQNRNRVTDIENRFVVTKGEGDGGGMEWEVGISRCKLSCTGWINNKVLL